VLRSLGDGGKGYVSVPGYLGRSSAIMSGGGLCRGWSTEYVEPRELALATLDMEDILA
jgi:hypothetical protein